MSAPVTKEHCALWNKLYNLAFNECFGGDSSDAKAAQLIADSEAEAVEAYAASTRELLQSYMTERDQLRAEVERLRDGGVQRIKDAMAVVMDERDSFKARAERAELRVKQLEETK